jgi:hypothetical protein
LTLTYYRTGDTEPGREGDVLVHHVRTAAEKRYLARFQHGWRWVNSKTELDRGDQTPLTWTFAMDSEPDGLPTEVRTPSDAELVDWLAS